MDGLVARGDGGGIEREDGAREGPVLGALEWLRDGRATGCEIGCGRSARSVIARKQSGAHGARGRWIWDDLDLTRLHKDTIVLWTREVGDAFNRAIILSDRFGKFNANPFASSEGCRAEKADDSATERNFNNGADGDVDGG